jgi:hypothetical protein
MPILTENTVVVDPKTGQPVLLAATGELPDWAVGLVGDHLLSGDRPAAPKDDEVVRLKARIAELEAAAAKPPSVPTGPASAGVVERPGRSDSREKWVAYAATQDAPEHELVPVDEGGLTRDRLREKYGN